MDDDTSNYPCWQSVVSLGYYMGDEKMTEQEMPDEVWVAKAKTGSHYWTKEKHDAFDKDNCFGTPQVRYVRADLPGNTDTPNTPKSETNAQCKECNDTGSIYSNEPDGYYFACKCIHGKHYDLNERLEEVEEAIAKMRGFLVI